MSFSLREDGNGNDEKGKKKFAKSPKFKAQNKTAAAVAADFPADHSQYPDEALVQLGVRRLQVVELYRFAEQLLVERQGEAAVDVVAVKNRQAHHATHKVEVRQVVLGDAGRRERMRDRERERE